MKTNISPAGQVPIVSFAAETLREPVQPVDLIGPVTPFKDTGVRIEITGQFLLSQSLVFACFNDLQLVGVGNAVLEQQNSFNGTSAVTLNNCTEVRIADLKLLGTGTPRQDAGAPEVIGLGIWGSRHVWVDRCLFGPTTLERTIQHGIHVADHSDWVWIRANRFRRITGSGVIVGSGIWPHPTDAAAFTGHECKNIHILDNDFDEIGTAVNIDDGTTLSWVGGNRVRLHYGAAITVEDGGMWFVITGNACGPGRAPAVSLRMGQSKVYASRGVVSNNTAAGCNNAELTVPAGFYEDGPKTKAFEIQDAKHVIMVANLDLPGG